MTATGGWCEPRSVSSQKTGPRGERAGLLISGIKSRTYEYLPLQSKTIMCHWILIIFSAFRLLISLGCAALLPGSVADLWLCVSPLRRIDSWHNKTGVGDHAVDCVGIESAASRLLWHQNFQHRASAGASKCEEKVREGIAACRWVLFVCFVFFLWQFFSPEGCKSDSTGSQFIHHCGDSVNTYLLQLAAASIRCGEKHTIHIPNCVLWLKCSTFQRNIKSVKLPRQQKNKGPDSIRGASECERKFKRASLGAALGVALQRPVFTRSGLLLGNLLWPVAGRPRPPLGSVIRPYT